MDSFSQILVKRLSGLKELNRLRAIPDLLEPSDLSAGQIVDLRSNDYLQLSRNPKIIQAACEAIGKEGAGSGAARLLGGNSVFHTKLEMKLAALHGAESCLLFNTGYMANLSLVRCFGELAESIYMDRLCHASLIDGVYYHLKKLKRFSHNDLGQLERMLSKSSHPSKGLVILETLHSMEGDFANLDGLFKLQQKYGFMLLLDEAHSFGGYPQILQQIKNNWSSNLLVIGTLGKALGSMGAFVSGSKNHIDYLMNHARPFIYSTALPASACAAALASLEWLEENPRHIKSFSELRNKTRTLFLSQNFNMKNSDSHIIPVILGSDAAATAASEWLSREGFYCLAVRPPTVPENSSRLRISLNSGLSIELLEKFCSCLNAFFKREKLS